MRVVFFGTPAFAVPILEAVCDTGVEVATVVCQPDRPAGRGLKLTPPPVKLEAKRRGLPVFQPEKLRDPAALGHIRALEPDACVVAAYGRIFPKALLAIPRLGCVHVHASLLPRLRGAAPINWAIINGEESSGISLMRMDEGMDSGPVYTQEAVAIEADETAGTLHDKLAKLGAAMIRRDLPRILAGAPGPTAQDHSRATLAPKLEPDLGRLDFARDALSLERLVRGLSPRPGAFTVRRGQRLKVLSARALPSAAAPEGPPGTAQTDAGAGIVVACSEGALALSRVQPEGRRPMDAGEYLAGHPLRSGERLGADQPALQEGQAHA
jgi:methionyl-tRNA formyltransferase